MLSSHFVTTNVRKLVPFNFIMASLTSRTPYRNTSWPVWEFPRLYPLAIVNTQHTCWNRSVVLALRTDNKDCGENRKQQHLARLLRVNEMCSANLNQRSQWFVIRTLFVAPETKSFERTPFWISPQLRLAKSAGITPRTSTQALVERGLLRNVITSFFSK